jgi:hypothetical protein
VAAIYTVYGGDVDYAAIAALLHGGEGESHGVEDRVEVDLDDLVPLLHREVLNRRQLCRCGGEYANI